MRNRRRVVVCGMALALILAAASQGLAAPAGPGAPLPTGPTGARSPSLTSNPARSLATAMLQATPPDGQIAIAIDADRYKLWNGDMPPPGSTVYQLAAFFEMLARPFGGVIAIAPARMTVLNTVTGAPNPFDDMPPADAFKLLVGSLTPAQWKTLTGAQGLGIGDLQSENQRELFRWLFADGIAAYAAPRPGDAPAVLDPQKIAPAELEQSRIRLSRQTLIELSGDHLRAFIEPQDSNQPSGASCYIATDSGVRPGAVNAINGVPFRKEAPNEPKTGNLDFDAAVLQTPVSLVGIHTVGDLVRRVDQATRVEIIPDRRYENQGVTIVAGARAARAADLLRALAFCLRGTYRLVRPAFVLTDDLVGVGTRRVGLEQFQRAAFDERSEDLEPVTDSILQSHPVSDLPPQPGSVSLTAGQLRQALKQQAAFMAGMGPSINLRMDQLTPDQQLAARRLADDIDRENEELAKLPQFQGQSFPTPALNGPIGFTVEPTVDLLLPSYKGPVSMDGILNPITMFMPSGKLSYERIQRESQNTPITPKRPAPPRPSLADGLRPFARRAVLVDARTADDVNSIVASMRKLGLNELWLEVFSPGIPEKSSPEAMDGGDLLTEALAAAHGTGIHVMPVLRLLEWGPPVPASVRDLTILGEAAPATQNPTLTESTDSGPNPAASSAPAAVWVSPFDLSVRKRLEQGVSKTAAQPGIAGMVWRKMSPPGYNSLDDETYTGKLGYTPVGRLAFLLSKHADPVDIDPVPVRGIETSLPGFDNRAIDNTLRSEWLQFRVDEDLSLLRDLRQIAAKASAAPVLVEARQRDDGGIRRNGWYGDWEGGGSPLPAERRQPVGWAEMSVQAHEESRTALFCFAPQDLGGADVASVLGVRTYGYHWDGVVLDLTTHPTGPGRAPTGAERLAALAK